MVNPCCCSLEAGTKAIAIIQIVGSVLGIIFGVGSLIMDQENPKRGQSVPRDKIIELYVSVVASIFALILGIVLLIGANKRDAKKCKIWLNVVFAVTVLAIIGTTFLASTSRDGDGLDIKSIVSILVCIYYIVVVHAFIEEIKRDPNPSHTV